MIVTHALVIAINYKTDEHAAELARSLVSYSNQDVSVIFVDNSERDDPEAFTRMIHAVNPDVQCLQAPANLGYFGGANFGLKQYLADFPLPEWVIICNVDIEFRDPGFFVTLRQLEATGGIGVVGPRIWSATFQRDVNPKITQRPTRRRMFFYEVIFGNYYLQAAYEILSVAKYGLKRQIRSALAHFLKRPAHNTTSSGSTPIYAAHGSCMILNRRYFVSGGSIEYPVFLFGEEIFVAETARQLGLLVVHCPQLWVFDKEHASTGGALRSRRVAGYMNEATRYLAQKYFAGV
jgi:GT2 family glycosyltransferase